MKHNLEKWRELILLLNSFLKWEQKYFAGVVTAVITFVFMLIWYLDLSFVTCIGLTGLIVTLFDYFYPKLSKMFFKSENWRGMQEKKFEEVTEEIFQYKNRLRAISNFIFDAKSEKSTLVRQTLNVLRIIILTLILFIHSLFSPRAPFVLFSLGSGRL